ncbi:MAG: dihydroorotate dehydrogenase electron transfer subunit [Gammaproteobacteria bacterium]|nr:MAG: dihydroorotate dehydrogenase electron transfer subunit [Gammaproteobacteria bacterium]RLA24571.1 MAG: dihydroorotate dehydrogenase electron transfer subunit [Gammaproteobacteria bacterium]
MNRQENSIFVEEARITARQTFAGGQHTMRLAAPKCAAKAEPGSFIHLRCEELLAMRRPISIMRANSDEGWIEILFKELGKGTRLLAQRQVGESLSLMGPIGNPFVLSEKRKRPLLIGGGVGIPPMVYLAESIYTGKFSFQPLVLMGSEIPFPFEVTQSKLAVSGVDKSCSATMPLLEEWDIPARLASNAGFDGCFEGFITDLARCYLRSLSPSEQQEVELFSCGPHPMLSAVAALAKEFDLPCQLSLEEYMACAVGGCAGCVVKVKTAEGEVMKRVCVDGPVFRAEELSF